MRRFIVVLSAVLASCTTVTTIPTQPAAPMPPLEVQVPVTPANAFDRVVSAFMAEGLTVEQADRLAGL